MLRTHTCGELRESNGGQTVTLCGWVHRRRDHGGLIFIDLRDRYGMTQIVIDPASPAFKAAEAVRSEWVLKVSGPVRSRIEGAKREDNPTGQIELEVTGLEVLQEALTPPFEIDESIFKEASEIADALIEGTPQGEEIIDFGKEILR